MTGTRPPLGRLLTVVAAVMVVTSSSGSAAIDTGQTRLFKYLMGTSMRVEAYGGDATVRRQAINEAFAAIAEVDRLMSDYRADSEIALLNRDGAGRPVQVSQALLALLDEGRRLSIQTGGAFSITAGVPKNIEGLNVDSRTRTVRFTQPGLTVSLDGAAKGFASELAAASLQRRGLAGTVDTSGTQYLVGLPPGKRVWSVGVGHPFRRGAVLGAIDVPGGAVSTVSAATHPLDLRTGRPATLAASATVVSPDGTLSDALSRAVFVLGPKDGLAVLADFPGTWGVVAFSRPDGSLAIAISDGHSQSFHPSPAS